MKAKLQQAKTTVTKWSEILLSLIVLVSITRAGVITWYNDTEITGLPFDRIVSGVLLSLVFSYFVWLHYKKK